MPRVCARFDSIKYTGSNGIAITERFTRISYVSEVAGVFTYLDRDGYERQVNAGEWLIFSEFLDGYPQCVPQAQYEARWIEFPDI
ncbi:hypothetical protein [Streptomyces sp. NPDC088789]|uniref:hypothetical protein n=1 Tax=Streptomyces sp. NPDC088789 TaxID=3365899 RepID=UPI00380B07D0